jgi:transcriptional regulator with XRE-family HTH domain
VAPGLLRGWGHIKLKTFRKRGSTVSIQEASIGKKLAVLAKLKGLTQEQIAKACSMSRISVNRFFRSHTEIRAGDLSSLLGTLGINLEMLIDKAIERQMNGSATGIEDPHVYIPPSERLAAGS